MILRCWHGSSEQETVEDNSRKTRERCCLAVSSRLYMTLAGLNQNRRPSRTKNRPINILTGGIQRCLRLMDSPDHPPLPDNTGIIDKQLAGLGPFGKVAFYELSMLLVDSLVV